MPRDWQTRRRQEQLGAALLRAAKDGERFAIEALNRLDAGVPPRGATLGVPPSRVPPSRIEPATLSPVLRVPPSGNRVSPKGREEGKLPGLSIVKPEIQATAERLTELARRVFKGVRLGAPDETTVRSIGRWLSNGPRTEKQAREFVYLRAARGSWDGGSKTWRPWKGSLHRLFDETKWHAERHANPDIEPTYEHLRREYTEAWPTWLAEIMEELGDAEDRRPIAPRAEARAAESEGPIRFGLGIRPTRVFGREGS